MQNRIGADIIMALDDVVKTTITGPRIEEAMYRTLRWIDRCIAGKPVSEEWHSSLGAVQCTSITFGCGESVTVSITCWYCIFQKKKNLLIVDTG